MSSYSTLIEAWGCENFTNKKKIKKKRRKHKERFQDYEEVHQGQDILNKNGESVYGRNRRRHKRQKKQNNYSRPLNINRMSSQSIEPIKIKLEENEADYEGPNSSDYEQYELQDNTEYNYENNYENNLRQSENNDVSVLQEEYEPNEVPYEEEYEPQYAYEQGEQVQQVQQAQYHYFGQNFLPE